MESVVEPVVESVVEPVVESVVEPVMEDAGAFARGIDQKHHVPLCDLVFSCFSFVKNNKNNKGKGC